MRSKLTKIALAAVLGLALALTLSCVDDDGGGGGGGGQIPPVVSGCGGNSSFLVASGGDDSFGDDNSGANISNKVIYVDGGWGGSEDGTSSNPYRTIQAAVDAASDSEIDIIKIAQGTYHEAVSISQKKVQLLGGFSRGDNFASANPQERITVIEGTIDAPCILVNIDEREIPGSLVISGFTIRKGQRGIKLSGGWSEHTKNITIKNNIIEENDVRGAEDERGGGIGLEGTNVTVQGNIIRGNKAGRGAAIGGTSNEISNFLIANNCVENNNGYDDHAGGVIISGTGMLTRNVFDGNSVINSYGWGGGITVVNEDTTKLITLSHNIWRNNHAPSRGGAVFVDEASKVSMIHELLYNNTSGESGSAVYVDKAGSSNAPSTIAPSILYMDNCTVSGNTSPGAALYVETSSVFVQNSIFWNNGSDFQVVADGCLTVNHTLTERIFEGTGNISSDPLFTNASTNDFHLQSNSPAIDAGNPSSDFSKEPAPNGGRVNLGCYGNTAEASISAVH
ncbi:MAG: right-handed parallel beta-helix repeat-containing protein [Chitinispirillales bacterium]|jgi:hypothetical protein|nr:right-handed parallel beta-helix repeat-containing protein [Chitinispirillales bacterium]